MFIALIFILSVPELNAQDKTAEQVQRMKPALLVIDIQNSYLSMIPDRDKEVGLYMINAYIDLFRKNNFPVIRIYHTDPEYGPQPDTKDFEFPETVQIKPEDPKVVKTYGNAFTKTDLDRILKEKNCNTLFLCGLSAVGCVLATYIGAHDHDYRAFLMKDAIMSHNSTYTDNIEEIFDAIGYDVVKVLLDNAEK
jgi:nicotinamidase-related amidase